MTSNGMYGWFANRTVRLAPRRLSSIAAQRKAGTAKSLRSVGTRMRWKEGSLMVERSVPQRLCAAMDAPPNCDHAHPPVYRAPPRGVGCQTAAGAILILEQGGTAERDGGGRSGIRSETGLTMRCSSRHGDRPGGTPIVIA